MTYQTSLCNNQKQLYRNNFVSFFWKKNWNWIVNGKLIFQQITYVEEQFEQHHKNLQKQRKYKRLSDKNLTVFTAQQTEKYLVSKESKSRIRKILKLHHHKVSRRTTNETTSIKSLLQLLFVKAFQKNKHFHKNKGNHDYEMKI